MIRGFYVYVYVATNEYKRDANSFKLGYSTEPIARLLNYQTGCCPKMSVDDKIKYEIIVETNSANRIELGKCECELHNQYNQFRLNWNEPGDSEWFRFPKSIIDPIEDIKNFVKTQYWFNRFVKIEDLSRISLVKPSTIMKKLYQ